MPFTPTHLGPSSFLFSLKPKLFNVWALVLGSVIMDLENVVLVIVNVLQGCLTCSHHGFFHSILGALLGSFLLALALNFVLGLTSHKSSFAKLFYSALTGWLSHIFLDGLVHDDVFLFWPIKSTPLLISWSWYWPLSYAMAGFGVLALVILIIKLCKTRPCTIQR
jgi:membrane-bound metal-dependent hydrolase YbcI (DUF457 family)